VGALGVCTANGLRPGADTSGESALSPTSPDTADGQRTRARVLGYFFLAGSGLGVLLLPFLPLARHTNRIGEVAVLCVAAALGILFMVTAERLPGWVVAGAVAFGTLQITAVIVLGHSTGTLGIQIAYVWVVVYSFYFLDRRTALVELAFVGVAYAGAGPNGCSP
jgi:hypothetical protein